MRLAYYAGVSTAAAAACLLKAFHQRPNFYSATVYLSQSNACLLILTNLLLVIVCTFVYGLQRLLYGPLRPIEIEQLSEKAWYAVLDTLLAMPAFREDVGGWLLAMFTLLLAGKVWGWIGEGRVDILEQQPPANPRLFHLRLATSLIVSVIFDLWMLNFCVETVISEPRPGMMVIFTFEFAILSVFSLFTLARYGLSVLGIRIEKQQLQKAIADRKEEIKAERAAARQSVTEDGQPAPVDPSSEEPIEVDENEVDVPGWEEKRRYLFALEVFTDFIKLLIYVVFFTVSITFNGLPMHIMRDVYMTFASFSKRVGDYMAYRKATSDMNTRYPDATTEEIRGDSCIVCRETMVAWAQPAAQEAAAQPAEQQPDAVATPARRMDEGLRAKRLPCGHILHLRCLKAWLERQQVCPTCRRPVVPTEESGQPAQAGAAGANGAANGQAQPQQPARRQNRARVFNLGPVRIGFLNGPEDQIGNIVRQIQNPNAAQNAGGLNQGQPENQQGPNHLGLQEPYAANATQAATGGAARPNIGVDSATSIQTQLMQVEIRLMQEAHNLGIEQQQLAHLRMLESELARLRPLRIPTQQTAGTGTTTAPQLLPLQQHPTAFNPYTGFSGLNQMAGQPYPSTGIEALHGSMGQQMGSGHEHLPPGMTLAEGWTVVPLHQSAGGGMADVSAQPSGSTVAPETTSNGTAIPERSTAAPSTSENTTTGPTDERGSPLFIPSSLPTSSDAVGQAQSQTLPPPAPSAAESSQQQAPAEHPNHWGSAGWSFAETPNGQDHSASNGASTPSAQQAADQSPRSDKGKGKAAEVEDAPDPGT